MHRLAKIQLDRLRDETEKVSELIEAYTGDAEERTTLMRVSRHLKLHQISAANLLVWLDQVGEDLVKPEEVLHVQKKLEETADELSNLVQDEVSRNS